MAYGTLRELYLQSIERYGDRPCSSMYEGEELTYDDFAWRVDEVVDLLHECGLRRGDKAALLSNNMPNWAVCYFATVISGMVVVPVLPDFSGEELGMIIEHCEARALFVSDKLFAKVPKPTIEKLNVVIRTMNLGVISRNTTGRDAVDGGEEDPMYRDYDPSPEDLAAIIYTSGTMSKPKGVMLTHGNLASQIRMEGDLFPVCREDVFLSILPLAHTYECSAGMLLPFSSGAQVVYLDKLPTASTLMPAMKKVAPTIMLSVPLIIEKIYRNQIAARFAKKKILGKLYGKEWFRKLVHRYSGRRLDRIFGGRLRFFGIGGAKLDADTERFLMEARFPYAIGYGLTETAPLIAGAVPGNVKFRSTGPPLKDVKVRLDNVNPQTGEGEIVVLSPSTMKGYYKDPEATASVFTKDGWLRTRDLGSMDDEGNLYIKGRLDNMIVGPDGNNIYPEEIESVINSHFLVTDSIVKEDKGRLVALVRFDRVRLESKYHDLRESLAHKMAEVKSELKNYTNSKIAKSSQISDIEEQHKEFEKTPTQKIKRFKYSSPPAKKKDGG